MAQLILNIEDKSILPSLRKVLAAIPGVSIVRSVSNKKKNTEAMTSYEKAMDDVRNGHVYEYGSLDDFIKEIG